MPKCCIEECDSRNESIFSVPKDSVNEWEVALNMNLNHNSKVCATHFNPQDIVTTWESGVGVSKYSICLKRPKLNLGALPIKRLKTNSNEIPFNNNLVIQNNNVKHEYNYFKSVNNTPDLQPFEIQHSEVNENSIFFELIFQNLSSLIFPTKWCSDVNFSGKKKLFFL